MKVYRKASDEVQNLLHPSLRLTAVQALQHSHTAEHCRQRRYMAWRPDRQEACHRMDQSRQEAWKQGAGHVSVRALGLSPHMLIGMVNRMLISPLWSICVLSHTVL